MRVIFLKIALCLGLSAGIFYLWGCQPKEVTAAKIYIQSNNWDKAIEQLELAVKTYPDNPEAHYLLGEAYARRGRFREMNEQFALSLQLSNKFENQIISVREKYWTEKVDAALKAAEKKDYKRAEELLKLAILINPNNYEAHKKLALIYSSTHKLNLALTIYKKLVEKYPDDLELEISLANLYYSLKEYENAIPILKHVLEIEPNHRDALANLALCYDALGKTHEAFQAYQKAIEANPLDQDLIFLFGVHQYMRHNYLEAIQLFQRVLELNPDDFEATVNIGNAYLSLAELEKKKLQKGNFNAHISVQEIQSIQKRALNYYKKSIPYYERALEMQPDNAKLWRNLGVAYINIGQKEKGEQALLRSDELKTELGK